MERPYDFESLSTLRNYLFQIGLVHAALCVGLVFKLWLNPNIRTFDDIIFIWHFCGQLGLNHTLLFWVGSGAPYSDMNGFTPYLEN